MTDNSNERHALAARLDSAWFDADPRAHREECLTQALLAALKEIEELRERVRQLEMGQ